MKSCHNLFSSRILFKKQTLKGLKLNMMLLLMTILYLKLYSKRKLSRFSHLPVVTNVTANEILNVINLPLLLGMKILREQIIDTYNNNSASLEHLREIKERQISF